MANRVLRHGAAFALVALFGLGLAACSRAPDPEVAREALAEVTEAPVEPDVEATAEFSAELHPEPMVEPLDCSPYLVITARGTSEKTKGQLLSPVARAISESRPDEVATIDLEYPADTNVNVGGAHGARLLIDTLNVQTEVCPEQRFVLLGYSQGALIVGDVLIAPELRMVGTNVGEIVAEAAERILAIVLYGDPRFLGSEPHGVGDFDESVNGLLPRPAGTLNPFIDRLRDYCVAEDFVCQSSLSLDDSGHIAYFSNGMQQDGAAFVITRLDPPGTHLEDDDESEKEEDTDDGDSGRQNSPAPSPGSSMPADSGTTAE